MSFVDAMKESIVQYRLMNAPSEFVVEMSRSNNGLSVAQYELPVRRRLEVHRVEPVHHVREEAEPIPMGTYQSPLPREVPAREYEYIGTWQRSEPGQRKECNCHCCCHCCCHGCGGGGQKKDCGCGGQKKVAPRRSAPGPRSPRQAVEIPRRVPVMPCSLRNGLCGGYTPKMAGRRPIHVRRQPDLEEERLPSAPALSPAQSMVRMKRYATARPGTLWRGEGEYRSGHGSASDRWQGPFGGPFLENEPPLEKGREKGRSPSPTRARRGRSPAKHRDDFDHDYDYEYDGYDSYDSYDDYH